MKAVKIKQLPRLVDPAAIEKANQEIVAFKDDEEALSKFIDDRADEYRSLREALWHLGSMKCWYSEAKLQQQQGQVEHFRPKKRVAKVKHPGYWWDAFDWTNLRLAHPTVNVRVTDYLTGKLAGKGTYFPLRFEAHRATDKAGEANESAVLLDPTVIGDCRLLSFELSSGRPIPRFKKEEDEWKFQRAELSIDFYHLAEATWTVDRKDLIDETSKLCDELISVAAAVPRDIERYELLVADLIDRVDHLAEFSSVALQVLCEKGVLNAVVPQQPFLPPVAV